MDRKRVFKTKTFDRWARKVVGDNLLCIAAREIEAGLYEADLGHGLSSDFWRWQTRRSSQVSRKAAQLGSHISHRSREKLAGAQSLAQLERLAIARAIEGGLQ